MNLVSKFGPLIIVVIILLTGESPLEVAQRGKYKDIVRMLKEKEDEELNSIAEVENINCEILLDLYFLHHIYQF